MSDELAHLETDLLGQLRKTQDYLDALETQNNELTLQNNSLKAQIISLHTAQDSLIERQLELTTQNDALKRQNQALLGQLNDAKTYQTGLMEQTKEAKKHNNALISQNSGLLQTQKELQTANQSLKTSIEALQSEQKQPPAPSMTQHDEQELLDLIDKKDALIETLEQTVMKMRESLSMLNV